MLEGDDHSVARDIPATLADSLMARLDRLGPAKEVAQLAAVLGREFSYEMLHAVSPMPEDELQAALAKLGDAELIYARGVAPDATYQFKHALVQDSAYEALLKSRRRELHRLVARAIADKFPAVADAQPEVLAHHWTEAGDAELAIAAWRKAADATYARHAFKEAEESYKQALAILNTSPESAERDARELDLMSPLVQVLQLTKGWNAPQAVEAVARSQALAEKSGDLSKLVLQVHGTWARALVAGDLRVALGLADQVLDLARREGSPASLGFAYQAELTTRLYCGDFAGSEEHFVRGREFFDAPGFRQAPGVHAFAFGQACINAWIIGRADSARERSRQSFAAARESNSPSDLVAAQLFAAALSLGLREPGQAETLSAQMLALSDAHGFPFYAAQSRILLGCARAHLGRTGEGVALIRQGLTELSETRTRSALTTWLAYLSEAQALDGATANGLDTIDEALAVNPEELELRPDLFRARRELLLKTGLSDLAEADFREAIALAQKMSAKTYELRATTSLARLLVNQGKRDEARAMLAEIYGWFTEGFDTADLRDAKALLDELNE